MLRQAGANGLKHALIEAASMVGYAPWAGFFSAQEAEN